MVVAFLCRRGLLRCVAVALFVVVAWVEVLNPLCLSRTRVVVVVVVVGVFVVNVFNFSLFSATSSSSSSVVVVVVVAKPFPR